MKQFILLFISFFYLLPVSLFSQWYQYTEQNSGVISKLNGVSGNMRHYWICGDSGVVLKTHNRGTNWINISGHGIPSYVMLNTIFGIDSARAVVCGTIPGYACIYATTNSGANFLCVNEIINWAACATRARP